LLRWETLLHGGAGGGATTATAEAEAEAAEGGRGLVDGGSVGGSGGLRAAVRRGVAAKVPPS
jgi:hypothetical protein